MSRVVPLDRALTVTDRRYLRQLGSAGDFTERRIDAEFPPDPEALAEFEREELKRHAKLNGTGLAMGEQDRLMEENDALRKRIAELEAMVPPPADNRPSFAGWTKAQLEAEVDRVNAEDEEIKAGTRQPIAKGKVVDMVTALTDYFTE